MNEPTIHRTSPTDPRRSDALQRAARRNELVRLHPGAYVERAEIDRLTPRQQHVLRVRAAVARLNPRVVVSHGSAAAVHRLPSLGPQPTRVHVIDPCRPRTQSWNRVVKHTGRLDPAEVTEIGEIRLTSLARTAADIALSSPRRDAVVLLDSVLASGGTTADEVVESLTLRPRPRALTSALHAIEFASALAQSPGESLVRVVLDELGVPPPVLQEAFSDKDGAIGYVDFWFADQGVVLEFDGVAKYTQPRYLSGRSSAGVVVDEKRREDRLRRCAGVQDLVRCDWRDARDPERLAGLLKHAGVPLLRPP